MFRSITHKQLRALLAAAALMAAYGLTNNCVGYFVAPVTENLGIPRASFNLYFTIMSLASLAIAPFFGHLLQRVPIRRIIFTGGVIGSACFAAFAFCRAIPMFYIVALILGLVQNGCTSMTAVVIITRVFQGGSGSFTGLAMAGTGVCSVIMSLLLPGFMEATSWNAGYLLLSAVWLAMLILAALLLDERRENVSNAQSGESSAPLTGATYAQALHSPQLYILLVCVVLLNASMIFIQHMPAFFVEMGTTATLSGTIMSVFSVFLIVCKISLGNLFDRLGGVKTTLIALCCYAAGLWVMLGGSIPLLCAGAALSAFGMASTTVLIPLITKLIFGQREFALIWSLVSMATVMGTAIGSPAWGMVYDHLGSYRPAVMIVPLVVIADAVTLAVMLCKTVQWETS